MLRSSTLLVLLACAGCSNGLTALGDSNPIPVDPGDTDDGTPTNPPIDTDTPVGPANQPPNAVAGGDQTGLTGAVIALDGSASSDPDGDTLNFLWVMQSNPANWTGSIINEDRVDAQFFADRPGVYVVEIQVDDGEFAASDTLTVTIEEPNDVPVANAGADQYVDEGDLVQLNGSNSYDPDSDPLTYAWTIIDGPTGSGAVLDDPQSPLPRFTAGAAGVYSVELVVTDLVGNTSAPDTVRVTAQGGSSSGGDSGCLSCVAAQNQLRNRAAIPAFFLFPLLIAGLRRRG